MAGLYAPLPTLRSHPRGGRRTDRGRRGLLLLHRSGLSPHTPCRSPGALTRVAACTLARSPIRDPLSEGFRHFVSSMSAPVASGWSGRRVGLAPTGKAPPCHGARGERSFATTHLWSHSLRCVPSFPDPGWVCCGEQRKPNSIRRLMSSAVQRWVRSSAVDCSAPAKEPSGFSVRV